MSPGAQQRWYARWTAQALGVASGSAFTAASLVSSLFNALEVAGVVGSGSTTTAGRVLTFPPEAADPQRSRTRTAGMRSMPHACGCGRLSP